MLGLTLPTGDKKSPSTVSDRTRHMFRFNRDFAGDSCRARSLEFSRKLNPRLKTFSAWLGENKGRIPLE